MRKAKLADGKRKDEPAMGPDALGPQVLSPSAESRTVLPAQDIKANLLPSNGNSALRNERLDAPSEDRVLMHVGRDGPLLPGNGHGEFSAGLQRPLGISVPLPGDVSSSSSSSLPRLNLLQGRSSFLETGITDDGSRLANQGTTPKKERPLSG